MVGKDYHCGAALLLYCSAESDYCPEEKKQVATALKREIPEAAAEDKK